MSYHRRHSGGGAPAITPDLYKPVAWWRADSGVTIGTGASDWLDRTGNYLVSQATGSQQPTLNASDPNFNGKASLSFSAAALQYLFSAAAFGFVSGNPPVSVFCAIRRETSSTDGIASCGDNATNANYYYTAINSGGTHLFRRRAGTTGDVNSLTALALNAVGIFGQVCDASGNVQMYTDGVADGSGVVTENPTGEDAFAIGALLRVTDVSHLDGRIAELLYFDYALPAVAVTALQKGYFAPRYGL